MDLEIRLKSSLTALNTYNVTKLDILKYFFENANIFKYIIILNYSSHSVLTTSKVF